MVLNKISCICGSEVGARYLKSHRHSLIHYRRLKYKIHLEISKQEEVSGTIKCSCGITLKRNLLGSHLISTHLIRKHSPEKSRAYSKKNEICYCGIRFYLGNKSQHLKSKKHFENLLKICRINLYGEPEILENARKKCSCGMYILSKFYKRHLKNPIHFKRLENLDESGKITCSCGTMINSKYLKFHLSRNLHYRKLKTKLHEEMVSKNLLIRNGEDEVEDNVLRIIKKPISVTFD